MSNVRRNGILGQTRIILCIAALLLLLLYREELACRLAGINADRIRVTFRNIKQAF